MMIFSDDPIDLIVKAHNDFLKAKGRKKSNSELLECIDRIILQTQKFSINGDTKKKNRPNGYIEKDYIKLKNALSDLIALDTLPLLLNSDRFSSIFKFVYSFGETDEIAYSSMRQLVNTLFRLVISRRLPENQLFMLKNPHKAFSKDFTANILRLQDDDFEYFIQNANSYFKSPEGNESYQTYFKMFMISIKEIEGEFLDDRAIHAIIVLFCIYLSRKCIQLMEPLSVIRKFWTRGIESQSILNDRISIFDETLEYSKNPYLALVYLLFLFDAKVTNFEKYQSTYNSSSTKRTITIRFAAYLAVYYFFDIANVKITDFMEFVDSPATLNLSKSLGNDVTAFITNASVFVDRPWHYVSHFVSIPELNFGPDVIAQSYRLDIPTEKCKFSLNVIDLLNSLDDPTAICVFAFTVLKSAALFPPMVRADPTENILKYCLVPLLRADSSNEAVSITLRHLMNNVTLRYLLPTNAFAVWTQRIILDAFSDSVKKRENAFRDTCVSVVNFHPGVESTVPVFLYLFNQVDITKFDVLDVACAFAAAQNTDYHKGIGRVSALLKKYSISTEEFESFDFEIALNQTSKIYAAAPKEQRANVVSTICQMIIESAYKGEPNHVMEDTILKAIPEFGKREKEALLIFENAADKLGDFISEIIKILCSGDPDDDSLNVSLQFFTLCSKKADLSSALEPFVKATTQKDREEFQISLCESYARYPYVNGINYAESHINMFETQVTPLTLSNGKSVIAAGHTGRDTYMTLSIKSKHCGAAMQLSVLKSDIPAQSKEPLVTVLRPLYDPSIEFGEVAKNQPLDYRSSIATVPGSPKRSSDSFDRQNSPPPAPKGEGIFHISECLHQLGFLAPSGTEFDCIHQTPMIQREARNLFSTSSRCTHKIAILYVGPGQRTQDPLLANQAADISARFSHFIERIGWPVDLTTHRSFTGGLDTNTLSNGRTSLFYADALHEVMWHVGPILETSANDTKNIYKKRHIGNDSVHVLWVEDNEEYRPSTIISQFNHAHIVVYPLSDGRFAVHVHQKEGMKWFAGLHGKNIVTEEALALFVRHTAISADSSAREFTAGKRVIPAEICMKSISNIAKERQENPAYEIAVTFD